MFTEIRSFYLRQVKQSLRNPAFLIMGITSPALYLVLFAPLLKSSATMMGYSAEAILDMFVPGMLAMIAFDGGFFAGFGVIDELRSGVIERFRVSPVRRFSLLAGPVLHDLTAAFLQMSLFIILAVPFGFHMRLLGLPLLFALLALLLTISSSVGNALGLLTKSEDKLAPIVHGLNLPILLLSGTLLPLSLAPAWLKTLAHFNPVFYAVEAARALVLGNIADPIVTQAFSILAPLAVGVMVWASGVYRKAVM